MAIVSSTSLALTGIKYDGIQDIPNMTMWWDASDIASLSTVQPTGSNPLHVALCSTSTIIDASSTHSLTAYGTITSTYDATLSGHCWEFNNSPNGGNKTTFPKTASGLNMVNEFTVEFWVNPSSFGLSAATVIYDQSTFIISILPDRRVQVIVGQSSFTNIYTTNIFLTAGIWSHVAFSKNVADSVFYAHLNGKVAQVMSCPSLSLNTIQAQTADLPCTLGGMFGNISFDFSGKIANFRIWTADRYTLLADFTPTYANTAILNLSNLTERIVSWKNKGSQNLTATQTNTNSSPLFHPQLSAVWFDRTGQHLKFSPSYFLGNTTNSKLTTFWVYHRYGSGVNSMSLANSTDADYYTTSFWHSTDNRINSNLVITSNQVLPQFSIAAARCNNISDPGFVLNSSFIPAVDRGVVGRSEYTGLVNTIGSVVNNPYYGTANCTKTVFCEFISTTLDLPNNELQMVSSQLSAKWQHFQKDFGILPTVPASTTQSVVGSTVQEKSWLGSRVYLLSSTVVFTPSNYDTSSAAPSGSVLPYYIKAPTFNSADFSNNSAPLIGAFVCGSNQTFSTVTFSITALKQNSETGIDTSYGSIPLSAIHKVQICSTGTSREIAIANPSNAFLTNAGQPLSAGWVNFNLQSISQTGTTNPCRHPAYNIAFSRWYYTSPCAITNGYRSTQDYPPTTGWTGGGSLFKSATNLSNAIAMTTILPFTNDGNQALETYFVAAAGVNYNVWRTNGGTGHAVVISNTENGSGGALYIWNNIIFRLPGQFSTDYGVTWNNMYTPPGALGGFGYLAIHCNGNRFIALGDRGDTDDAITSTDGINWVPLSIPKDSSNRRWTQILYGNGIWIVQNSYGIRRSYDNGFTWGEFQPWGMGGSDYFNTTQTFTTLPYLESPNRFLFHQRRFWVIRYTDGDGWLRGAVSYDTINWTGFAVYNTKFNIYESWQWVSGGNLMLGVGETFTNTNNGVHSPYIF